VAAIKTEIFTPRDDGCKPNHPRVRPE
jgi:hypothetical protein